MVKQQPSEKIDWNVIAKQLKRTYFACKSRWAGICVAGTMKSGEFTKDEDITIYREVQAWKDKGNGLWKSLEKCLNRKSSNIRKRALKLGFKKNKDYVYVCDDSIADKHNWLIR